MTKDELDELLEPKPTKDTLEILQVKLCNIQVCCPKDWTDEKVELEADIQHPTGLSHGWCVQEENCPNGSSPKVPCAADDSQVHVILVC